MLATPHRRVRSIYCQFFLFGLLVLLTPTAPATSPSRLMSQAMLVMMDALGNLAHRYKNRGSWSIGGGYSPYSSLYGLSGYPLNLNDPLPPRGAYPPAPPYYQPQPGSSPLDGVWLGAGGEIVLVMYSHFRIYATSDVYRDGRFAIIGNRLLMYDPLSETRMAFDYHLEDGRMFLRNETGSVLAFKQLPISIPPYTRFDNPPPRLR